MVHSSVKKELLNQIQNEIEKAKYAFENDNYVQIVDEKNMNRLVKLINKSKVVIGGSYDMLQRYFEPTVLDMVNFDDAVMQEEIFGPILPLIEYEHLYDAIQKVKRLPKPLACYVFSEKRMEKERVLDQISFGGGCLNDCNMQITNTSIPFGGVGESGIGSYHGKFGFDTFSHQKGIISKNTWFESNLKYAPYSAFKFKVIRKLLGN